MLSRWTFSTMVALLATGGVVFGQDVNPLPVREGATRVAPVDPPQAPNPYRARAFTDLKAKAQQEGNVHVIVQLGVDRLGSLTKASVQADTAAKGAKGDAQLARAIKTTVDRELGNLAGMAYDVTRRFNTIPYVALRVDAATLVRLEAMPNVLGIEEDALSHPTLDHTVTIVGAPGAWADGWDGTGWAVAVLDTGIRATHEFFQSTNITQACFALGADGLPGAGDCGNGQSVDTTSANPAIPSPSNFEGYDHGTHVSGIAVGNGPGNPPSGVAREADLIHVKIFSAVPGGCGYDCMLSYNSDQIAGLEYVYGLRFAHNIASVNMSLGGSTTYNNQALCDAQNAAVKAEFDNLRAAGIATCVASGNGAACDGISAPACISSAVAVGATNDFDTEYGGNNWDPVLLDLFAPGVNVLSSTAASDTSYASFTGTSMATPHVAGAFAILKQAFPNAGVTEIVNALEASGASVNGGCGVTVPQTRIQIDAALALLGLNACCQDGEICTNELPEDCDLLGGKFRPGYFCSQLPDPCSEDVKFSQRPGEVTEAIASNIDWTDDVPNTVTADDFTSDGRPVRAVRWWGGADSAASAVAAVASEPVIDVPTELRRAKIQAFESKAMNPGPVPQGHLADMPESGPSAVGGVAGGSLNMGWGTDHYTNSVAELALDNPTVLTYGATHLDTLLTGAEFGDSGDCSQLYVLDAYGNTFGRLDIASGGYGVVGAAVPVGAEFWEGLALDPTNGTMYAVSTDCDTSSTIYTVDLATGVPTAIGSVTNAACLVAIAIDNSGQMFGLDLSDNLISIDKGSAAGTIVGPVGFDANYSQGMDFDENTNTLYLATLTDGVSARAELRTCDTATGATTLIGNIGNPPGNAELGGFAIPTQCLDRTPDGWFISFHEPYADNPSASTATLGLYYCDASVVEATGDPAITCDAGFTQVYRAQLDQCCLVHATEDSRTSMTPAAADGFHEARCTDYALDIQAVIGSRFESDGEGGCDEVSTGRAIDGNFWAWHTTDTSTGAGQGLTSAASTTVTMSGPDWLYGPWTTTATTCGSPNMAFELITDEILDGETDANGDGYPDSCLCEGAVNGTEADPAGTLKNRYLSFSVDDPVAAGTKQAIQITLVDLPEFPAYNGTTRWVGPPADYPEEDQSQPDRTFTAAGLACEPYFTDWSTLGLFDIFGGEIAPGSTYEVRIVQDCCDDLEDPSCYSDPIIVQTGKFGDITSPFDADGGSVQPDFTDISSAVEKFLATPTAPVKSLAQIVPNYPFPSRPIDFSGISAIVDAYLGQSYSAESGIVGPCSCPSAVTCGATPCTSDTLCGSGYCLEGFCTDACGRCAP